jgi:hypothetical protein
LGIAIAAAESHLRVILDGHGGLHFKGRGAIIPSIDRSLS